MQESSNFEMSSLTFRTKRYARSFDAELRPIRYGLRSLVLCPNLEVTDVQHDSVDLVNKLAPRVGAKAQRVIFAAIRPAKVGHHRAIRRKAGSCH
jgi:hypothetical protein